MGIETQDFSVFAAHQQMLRERLYSLLASLHPLLYADIEYVLKGPGKLLSSYVEIDTPDFTLPAGRWSLLTLLIAQHISPGINLLYAGDVAVATECFLCALDLLDDIEDGDNTQVVEKIGVSRVLNVSTTLLALTHRAILATTQYNVSFDRIICLLDILQKETLVATSGQHRDLLAEQRTGVEFSVEDCLEIATDKAGSLMRLACLMGAICAGADKQVSEALSQLGEALGIAHQLDNDCHDLYHLLYNVVPDLSSIGTKAFAGSRKTDLIRGKKTLPIVLSAKKGYSLRELPARVDEESKREDLRVAHESILASWGICLLYRERAREILQKLEANRPITPALRLLLNLT